MNPCPHCGHIENPAPALTEKQFCLMQLIQEWFEERGMAPTVDEMQTELEIASKSGVAQLLAHLETLGYISRRRYVPRGITVLRHIPKPRAWGELELAVDNTRARAS